MTKTARRHLLPLALCCLLIAACGGGAVFDKSAEIANASWSYDQALPFEFEIADTAKTYEILLGVTHADDFAYQNCYVQITTIFADGQSKKQPLSLELAGDSGIWNGDCGGGSCALEIPIQPKARFRQPGKYRISVEQFMRVNPLPGIKAISLKIKQLE
jgi:gliding motility-associated lipoprotein GldH